MRPLLILGSGSFAIELLDMVESGRAYQAVGFVNSVAPQAAGTTHAGLPVHFVDAIPWQPGDCEVVAGMPARVSKRGVDGL